MALNNVTKELNALRRVAEAVDSLNFGGSIALPWCIESFPKLDKAMKEWKKILNEKERQ